MLYTVIDHDRKINWLNNSLSLKSFLAILQLSVFVQVCFCILFWLSHFIICQDAVGQFCLTLSTQTWLEVKLQWLVLYLGVGEGQPCDGEEDLSDGDQDVLRNKQKHGHWVFSHASIESTGNLQRQGQGCTEKYTQYYKLSANTMSRFQKYTQDTYLIDRRSPKHLAKNIETSKNPIFQWDLWIAMIELSGQAPLT